MTKKQQNFWASVAAFAVVFYYFKLLTAAIILEGDAQGGIAYLFYGPLGLFAGLSAFGSVQLAIFAWQNRENRSVAIVFGVVCLICAAIVVASLIYAIDRFAIPTT